MDSGDIGHGMPDRRTTCIRITHAGRQDEDDGAERPPFAAGLLRSNRSAA
jgi:hypothetical protein